MENPSYRRPRHPSYVARGMETLLFGFILIVAAWIFYHFTTAPIPPVEEPVEFVSSDPSSAAAEPPAVRRYSFSDAEVPQSTDERPMSDLIAAPPPTPAAVRSQVGALPLPSSTATTRRSAADSTLRTTQATPVRTPVPLSANTGSARERIPLAVRALDERERVELEESLRRGLTRFGYDPRRPDIEGVADRIAADATVLDLAATLGLTSADVRWLAADYLANRTAAGTSSGPTRGLDPAPLAPRTLERVNP